MSRMICLSLFAVFCAIHLSEAIRDPKLTIVEKNHLDKDNREVEVTCIYAPLDATDKPTVIISKGGTEIVSQVYQGETNDGPKIKALQAELGLTVDPNQKDNKKTSFKMIKPKPDQVAGNYKCTVSTENSIDYPIYATTEVSTATIESQQSVKSKDTALVGMFRDNDDLDATCYANVPTDTTPLYPNELSKVEFIKDNKVYMEYTKAKQTPSDVTGIKKENVIWGKFDDTTKTASLTIKKAEKDTAGKFSCKLYTKVKGDGGAEVANFVSTEVELKYKSGASASMASLASISTLLIAVISYMRL